MTDYFNTQTINPINNQLPLRNSIEVFRGILKTPTLLAKDWIEYWLLASFNCGALYKSNV